MSNLTYQEQCHFATLAHAGDISARNKLIENNLGIARQLANSYARTSPGHSADDLYQEAVLKLFEAVDTFNPSNGTKFNSWAGTLINRRLLKIVTKARQYADIDAVDPVESAAVDIGEAEEARLNSDLIDDCLIESLALLPPVEANVFRLYHGINSEPLGFTQIAKRLGTSYQHVERIYQTALKRVRREFGLHSNEETETEQEAELNLFSAV